METNPLPKVEDLLASLAGGAAFSKLDLKHAYQQVVLDEETKQLVTINTHKGLYRVNRLPLGVSEYLQHRPCSNALWRTFFRYPWYFYLH